MDWKPNKPAYGNSSMTSPATAPLSLPFTCADGARNELSLYPCDNPSAAWFLLVPAMSVPARKYHDLATSFKHAGLNCAVFDLRGVAKSSIRATRNNNFSYATLVEQDLTAAIQRLTQETNPQQLYLFGHSLGGQISLLYTAAHREQITGIVLSASCSVYYRGWNFPTALGLLVFSQFVTTLAAIIGYFPGQSLGFGGREARGVMRDWARIARSGNYHLDNTTIDYPRLMAKLTCPILAVNYTGDYFAPPAATDYLLANAPKAPVTRAQLSAQDLNLPKVDHINWLTSPQALVDIIQHQWL